MVEQFTSGSCGRALTETGVVRAVAPTGAWSGQPAGEYAPTLLQAGGSHIPGAAPLP